MEYLYVRCTESRNREVDNEGTHRQHDGRFFNFLVRHIHLFVRASGMDCIAEFNPSKAVTLCQKQVISTHRFRVNERLRTMGFTPIELIGFLARRD